LEQHGSYDAYVKALTPRAREEIEDEKRRRYDGSEDPKWHVRRHEPSLIHSAGPLAEFMC
jgi:hypothetical protein